MKVLDGSTPTTETKPPRVSFATSPDKTIDSTPPSSPEHLKTSAPNNAAAHHEDDDAPRLDENEDEFIRAKHRGSKPLSALRVNKILCRVPSHESNISDLSASLSPSYVRSKSPPCNVSPVEKENPIYTLLNACGVAGNISDLISSNPNLLGSGMLSTAENESSGQQEAKAKNPMEFPPVWGLAPYVEGEEQDEEEVAFTSAEPTLTSSEVEIIYDNVELVLDESTLQRAPSPPPQTGRRSPFAANGILKKKVSGIIKSGRYSPKPQPSPPAVLAIADSEARSATTTDDFARGLTEFSRKNDLASFEDEIPRPSPADVKVDGHSIVAATAAAVAAMASSSRSSPRSSPVEKDSISGEINENIDESNSDAQNIEPVKVKDIKKKSNPPSRELKSKTSITKPGRKETKKMRSSSLPSSPSRKFLRGLPGFKRGKSVAKSDKKIITPDANVLKKKDISIDKNTALRNTESRKKNIFKKKSPASLPTSTSSTLPTTTNPIPTPAEVVQDAKYWKATLDQSSSKTYYYHSKTKVVTWDKPPGFDEAQKLRENKFWRETVDANTGRTYYYHAKTKEVSWTKPEGYCEKSKKKESEVNGSDENVEKEMNKEKIAEVNMSEEKLSSSPVEKQTTDKASSLAPLEKKSEDEITPPLTNDQSDVNLQANVNESSIHDKAVEEQKNVEITPNLQNEAANPKKEIDEVTSQPLTVERTNSIEDAPFDEPTPSTLTNKHGLSGTDEGTRGPNVTMTNNQGQTKDFYKSIDFTTRTKTFMSQMTDKTPKFNNTTSTIPTKDFTDTQIDVNMTAETPADKESNANTSSIDSSLNSAAEDPPITRAQTTADNVDVPVNSKQNIKASSKKGARRDESSANVIIDDEESAVFDDWSDEVSELSGIGNDERPGKKKLLIGRNGKNNDNNKGGKDQKLVSYHNGS